MVTYSPSGEACFKLALDMDELGPFDVIKALAIQVADSALLQRRYWQTSKMYESSRDSTFWRVELFVILNELN